MYKKQKTKTKTKTKQENGIRYCACVSTCHPVDSKRDTSILVVPQSQIQVLKTQQSVLESHNDKKK